MKMHRLFLAFAAVVCMLLPSCRHRDDGEPDIPSWPTRWFTTPEGRRYGFIGPFFPHTPDDSPSIGLFFTREELEAELDLQVRAAASAHNWPLANVPDLTYVIVDDYVFRTGASPTGYAAGMTDSKTFMMLALYTRGTTYDPAIAATGPEWTRRPPGTFGYDHWRYGTSPYLPAMTHEFCHVFWPSARCGH